MSAGAAPQSSWRLPAFQVFSKSRPSTFCHRELFSASITSRPVPLVRQVRFLQRLLCVTGNRSGHYQEGRVHIIAQTWTPQIQLRGVGQTTGKYVRCGWETMQEGRINWRQILPRDKSIWRGPKISQWEPDSRKQKP